MPSASAKIKPFPATRQVAFFQLLAAARKTWLIDALADALLKVDPKVLRSQLGTYVPTDVQKTLAASGVRDEYVFPVPIVLEARPSLVGYYRLLHGLPQKTFYAGGSGMGQFRLMEERNTINAGQRTALPGFCKAMAVGLADLVRQISPTITDRDVRELPILTIGSQFQGGANVLIGKLASDKVFVAISDIVKPYIINVTSRKLIVKNAAGRQVVIELAADPDVRISEDVGGTIDSKVAIEIKGGTDKSNAYNRAGEAEKSHLKARTKGFVEFWTIIAKKGVDQKRLRSDSPTTTVWLDAAQVLGRAGPDWDEFVRRIKGAVGIK